MSYDFALWKNNPSFSITAGLSYLLLASGVDCIELADIDIGRLREQINIAFPGWSADGEEEASFWCELSPKGIILETYRDTPDSVILWFEDLAKKERLVFFDTQTSDISEQDQKECDARLLAAEAADDKLRASVDFTALETKASQGDAHACYLLGNRYFFGEGIQEDKAKAFEWYERSAELGDSDGMFNLAACYRVGDGVGKNIRKAIHWYERSSIEDKIFAPFELGEIYMNGEGVPVDEEAAMRCFMEARSNGNQDAGKPLRALGALPPLNEDPTIQSLENQRKGKKL